jgi:small-conductance mechanosensitive channel
MIPANVLVATVLLIVSYITRAFLVERLTTLLGASKRIAILIENVTWAILLIIVLSYILTTLGLSSVVSISGIVLLSLTLTLQTVVSSFMSGLVVITEKLFDVGDTIEVNGDTGVVEYIGLRVTKFTDRESTDTFYKPNTELFSSTIRIKAKASLDSTHSIVNRLSQRFNNAK